VRTTITHDPFIGLNLAKPWRERGWWPCAWIACPDAGAPPFVTAYRRRFALDRDATIRVHVTADERYDLFLDGRRIGRGSERGAPDLWFYETYDLPLQAGEHVLVARVWSLGDQAPTAQMSIHPGFLLAPEREWIEVLGTGVAAWEAMRLDGYAFVRPYPAWKGATLCIDGRVFPWGFERGEGHGWRPVQALGPGVARRMDWELPPQHLLHPATLPPMLDQPFAAGVVRLVAAARMYSSAPSADTAAIPVRGQDHLTGEADAWTGLLQGRGPLTVPPHTARRVLVDLENYYCAYPEIVTSGGAGSTVRLLWAEALVHDPDPWRANKGNRDEVEGKYFVGVGDTFLPDGGRDRKFETLWWEAGRYVEIFVQTAGQPLMVERFTLRETRYPLEMESGFAASDPRLARIRPLLVRGMQMCANETYFDCPYYEELMYTGDTRLEALATYVMTRDDRLPRKALRLFDVSRLSSGLTQSRYPSRVMQVIAPFSLWWVAMVADYALWRDDRAFVESLMPGVRATLEGFRRFLGPDGLLHAPEGWNVMDWVPAWSEDAGAPPEGASGVSGLLNWQLVYVLTLAADLEARLGEQELAARYRRLAAELAVRATETFWDEDRGLLADDADEYIRARQHFSEHTQCMAILSGQLDPARRARVAAALLPGPSSGCGAAGDGRPALAGDSRLKPGVQFSPVPETTLARTTIYFSHYLFETYRELGRIDALVERLGLWFDLAERDFKTPVESPEPSRSDCHAWGSHPLYHYFATILGIRPASLGFRSVEIAPQLGPLTSASGRLVHPAGGEIVVDFRLEDGTLHASVTLPPGLTGTLCYAGQTLPLTEGTQEVSLIRET